MLRRSTSLGYRFQQFEMFKPAKNPFYYPNESPNTSYFFPHFREFWATFGWAKEEMWFERHTRRYETQWQMLRKMLVGLIPALYILPLGMPSYLYRQYYGPYGNKVFLSMESRTPFDNMYGIFHGNTMDGEWQRHIHSKDNY